MEKKLISTNSVFERDMAFSRAVVVDKMVFVSGCTGYNYATHTISDSIEEQLEQTIQNIIYALEQAGASLSDVVRANYIVPNPADIDKCYPIVQKYFNDIRPACTLICANLISDKVKVEIEVTAVKK
ncbi:MAG: RidA family protein [Raineya sp.]|jgi:enamine deaminase RidA (YjgF/YER057c/UK114 family)|nr:RidA family protein [Raineya sp.]